MGIDEHFFTRRKGYATTLCDLRNHKVYDVVLGRSELSLEAVCSQNLIVVGQGLVPGGWDAFKVSPDSGRDSARLRPGEVAFSQAETFCPVLRMSGGGEERWSSAERGLRRFPPGVAMVDAAQSRYGKHHGPF